MEAATKVQGIFMLYLLMFPSLLFIQPLKVDLMMLWTVTFEELLYLLVVDTVCSFVPAIV